MAASKTTDSGSNWVRYPLGSGAGDPYCIVIDPSNSNVVYVGGYESSAPAIYKTTTAGSNWSKLSGSGLLGYVYALAIHPQTTDIIYAGTNNGVFKSTNGGSNWVNTGCSGGRTNALVINLDDPDIIYAGTNSNGVYCSTDEGNSWATMNDGLDELAINKIGINPGNYLYAGTNGKAIYRWGLQGVEEEANFRAKSIVHAVPNPFTGETMIHYHLPRETHMMLSIYDVQGRLVKVIDNGVKVAGSHEEIWHGLDERNNRVAAGVYFCKLQTGKQTHIKKLILMR